MPALTIFQPWASLIVDGVKVHETRPWPCPRELFGERLLIHAGAPHVDPQRLSFQMLQLTQRVYAGRLEPLPYGALVGSVRVVACRRTESTTPASPEDRTAGDWKRGRFAWELADPRPFKVARPIRGQQRVWYVERPDLWRDDD